MHTSRSTATPNAVDARSLIRLYLTTLEARGCRPSAIWGYRGALKPFLSWAVGDRLEVSKATASFSVSNSGLLAYRTSPVRFTKLVLLDRSAPRGAAG